MYDTYFTFFPRYWSKVAIFSQPLLHNKLTTSANGCELFWAFLTTEPAPGPCIRWCKYILPNVLCLQFTAQARHRQTDRQTDGQTQIRSQNHLLCFFIMFILPQKSKPLDAWWLANVEQFSKHFHQLIRQKIIYVIWQRFPPRLKYVATLHCEIRKSKKYCRIFTLNVTSNMFKGVLQSKKWISQNYTRRVVYLYTSYFG